ncbi:hypothetical protein OEA41_010727 [Lepraria neglecta]|uniref:Uncharacterized protein n=1 Tax=Lepraria neglecta TaxID=209136 RepID=A0AAD9YX51_9LECA|nr:hypothetical protein OEA41_010727 [Lepraria neglecta]
MSSDDLKRRTELQKGLESFSATHNGFPGEYGLGEEDAKFFAEFKLEAYWWTKDLLSGEVEALHDLWKEKVEKRGKIGDKDGKVEELSKTSNKKLKEGIRELKREIDEVEKA